MLKPNIDYRCDMTDVVYLRGAPQLSDNMREVIDCVSAGSFTLVRVDVDHVIADCNGHVIAKIIIGTPSGKIVEVSTIVTAKSDLGVTLSYLQVVKSQQIRDMVNSTLKTLIVDFYDERVNN